MPASPCLFGIKPESASGMKREFTRFKVVQRFLPD